MSYTEVRVPDGRVFRHEWQEEEVEEVNDHPLLGPVPTGYLKLTGRQYSHRWTIDGVDVGEAVVREELGKVPGVNVVSCASTAATEDATQMHRMQYTDEQRAEALRLLAEVGKAEAARRTGIRPGTIASWGSRHGVTAPPPEQMLPAYAARAELVQATWAVRKVALGERIGTIVETMAGRIEERLAEDRMAGVRDLAASMAILVDRAQLLTGGATSRTETVERTPEAEAEVAKVLSLARSA